MSVKEYIWACIGIFIFLVILIIIPITNPMQTEEGATRESLTFPAETEIMTAPSTTSVTIPSCTEELPTIIFTEGNNNALITWQYLKSLNFNNAVCAGILGNIMAECGDDTLKLDIFKETPFRIGICQWKKDTISTDNVKDLFAQLKYLEQTIAHQIYANGDKYKKGFGYADFLMLTDLRDTAEAFAVCYSEDHFFNLNTRILNALEAYQTFA